MSGTDATSSFSGYLYQADVAVLVALEKIISLKDTLDDLDKWYIEVEGEEDFMIIKKEGEVTAERHLYQVKEYESTAPGKYHEAVVKLFKDYTKASSLINNKYYICSKKKINVSDKNDYINKLKQSQDEDVLFQKCLCGIENDVAGLLASYITYTSDPQKKKLPIITFVTSLNNKDYINHPFSDKIGTIGDGGFLDSFNFGDITGYGEFTDIHEKIKVILRGLNSHIDPQYHLRYLESKIKRYIQNKKNKVTGVHLINLREISGIITTDTDTIIDCIISGDGYEDIFFSHYKASFDKYSTESIVKLNFPFLVRKSDEDLRNFKEDFLREISNNVFINNEKLKEFIKQTSPHIDNEYFSISSPTKRKHCLDNLLVSTTEYIQRDLIKRKIAILVRLYHLSYNHAPDYKENGYFNDDILGIRKNHKTAICIGTSDDLDDFRDIISNNPQYLFEHDYLGVKGHSGRIGDRLNQRKIQDGFDGQYIYKNNMDNIRKVGDVRFFCLGCHEHFMDSDCGSINDCPHKTLY